MLGAMHASSTHDQLIHSPSKDSPDHLGWHSGKVSRWWKKWIGESGQRDLMEWWYLLWYVASHLATLFLAPAVMVSHCQI